MLDAALMLHQKYKGHRLLYNLHNLHLYGMLQLQS